MPNKVAMLIRSSTHSVVVDLHEFFALDSWPDVCVTLLRWLACAVYRKDGLKADKRWRATLQTVI